MASALVFIRAGTRSRVVSVPKAWII